MQQPYVNIRPRPSQCVEFSYTKVQDVVTSTSAIAQAAPLVYEGESGFGKGDYSEKDLSRPFKVNMVILLVSYGEKHVS